MMGSFVSSVSSEYRLRSRVRMLLAGVVLMVLAAACTVAPVPGTLVDLQVLPQDLQAYIEPGGGSRPLLPAAAQERWLEDFRRRYLAPWQPHWSKRSADDLFEPAHSLLAKAIYGSNRLPVPAQRRAQWLAACAIETFPNSDYPAVTLRGSSLRGLPTRQPVFLDFNRAGEGFPFDYLQHSSIPAGTPVRVRQRSADGAWLLVESDALFGWLPATDAAPVSPETAARYAALPWVVAIRDGVPLSEAGGEVLALAGLGSLWPQTAEGKVLVPMRGDDGQAALYPATMPDGDAQPFPIALTSASLAQLGNRLMGKPYDWGGQFDSRDCSATLRDLFACFGMYLPRNSASQASMGRRLELGELSPAERERAVKELGRPWVTLAYMPGHIMLYVGTYAGQPVFMHTLWGLKTKDRAGVEGRYLVGQTVVTGLRPGRELGGTLRLAGTLGQRLKGLVLLEEPGRKRLPGRK